MNGTEFAQYIKKLVVLKNGRSQLNLSASDMVFYLENTKDTILPNYSLTRFDSADIKYAGVDAEDRPANLDLARVRALVIAQS